MDPTTAITGLSTLIGLGLKIGGLGETHAAAVQSNEAQKQIIGLEQQQEQVRFNAMHLTASRMQLQSIRNAQSARAQALAAATNQGAAQGSGLQGGYSQIEGQTNTNLLGISQNLMSGQKMFALDSSLSQQKIALANAQMKMQTGNALGALGGDLLSIAPAAGRLGGGLGSFFNTGNGPNILGRFPV
jgi:hypothetical protein